MATITWTLTPLVKEVTLPSGNTYYLKDADVRNWIGTGASSGAEYRITELESAVAALSNATHWLGITTTALSDGATTNPITIGGESVTAVSGDIVQYNDTEFIFNGTAWQEFGASIGTLKAFAFVDTGTVTITPAGTNAASAVTFSGGTDDSVLGADTTISASSSAVSFSGGSDDSVLGADTTFTNSTSAVTFSGGTDDSVLGADTTFTAADSAVTFSGGTDDTVLGADTTFTNASSAVSFSGQADGKLVKTSVPNVTSVGSAASWGATVSDEVLTFSWTPDVVPTLGTAIDVATGAIAADGTGATVVTAVGTGTAAAQVITVGSNDEVTAITGIGTGTAAAQTITVGDNDEVTAVTGIGTGTAAAQTITVGSNDTVTAVTSIGTGTAAAQSITVGSNDTVTAITDLGTATAAAQTITVGTDDLVTAVTDIGTGTAAAQTFTGTEATHTVYPTSGT